MPNKKEWFGSILNIIAGALMLLFPQDIFAPILVIFAGAAAIIFSLIERFGFINKKSKDSEPVPGVPR